MRHKTRVFESDLSKQNFPDVTIPNTEFMFTIVLIRILIWLPEEFPEILNNEPNRESFFIMKTCFYVNYGIRIFNQVREGFELRENVNQIEKTILWKVN